MGDKYDEMKGPELAEELTRREIAMTGKVDELRARLREDDEKRAQASADGPEPGGEGEETEADDAEIPEPREPARIQPYGVKLNEEQARLLTAGEARLAQFFKHVTPTGSRKYAAGDQVMAVASPEDTKVRVLPFGIEIELSNPAAETEG